MGINLVFFRPRARRRPRIVELRLTHSRGRGIAQSQTAQPICKASSFSWSKIAGEAMGQFIAFVDKFRQLCFCIRIFPVHSRTRTRTTTSTRTIMLWLQRAVREARSFTFLLPIKNRSVLCPNRCGMHHLLFKRVFPGLFLIDFDSESRGLRWKPVAILGLERTSHNIPAPRDIRLHVFLDQKVWRRESEVQGDGIRNRPQRVMGRDAHLVCLCHCSDFFRFHDSSTMAEIGLDHVAGSLFENGSKLMAPHQSLPGGDRNSYRLSHLE